MSTDHRFIASDYRRPHWLPDGHSQTLYAYLFADRPELPYRRERIDTPDGDFVDLDWVDGPAGSPIVVLFHGLEGSSRSHYALALMERVRERGWRGVIPHFRGCSGEDNRLPRAYHSGDADEIAFLLQHITRHNPGAAICTAGVSLGGNALLKWLGREGPIAGTYVRGAVAVSAPVDLAAAGFALETGFNRLYTWHFLQSLRPKSLAKAQRFPGRFDPSLIRRARTMRQFDDAVTAPIHGFQNALDYWRRASSKPDLPAVQVPTLLINARNDPFLPASALPKPHEVSPMVSLEQPLHGGHVGFTTGPFPGRHDWLAHRILTWFAPLMAAG